MAVRKIRIWPDPALKEVAAPVHPIDDEVRRLVSDLFETMYQANGVGLAATQVAVTQRVLVIDLDPHGQAKNDAEVAADLKAMGFAGPTAFINPEIVESEGEILWEEGCLSVPGVTEQVRRHERVVVRALDMQGQPFELNVNGLFAVAVQHEIDHLDGKVFVEYLSKLKRDVIKRKMERLKVEAIDDGVAAAAIL
ncbi:MAG: peptide deformylase [Deltaproteobacteria bacterium]|nr:peptide deformylase [Deltaproteobacteria bacterium]